MKPLYEIIDVSEHNTRRAKIDWEKVKASGVKGVMVRIGWAGYDGRIAGNNGLDDAFEQNIIGAYNAGLDVGLYVYSYTRDPAAARIAAEECIEIAKQFPQMITLPIAFDVEETNLSCLTMQGRDGLANTINAFCFAVEQLGYYPIVYTYTFFAVPYINMKMIANRDFWVADYRGNEELMRKQLGRDFGMWQYIGGDDPNTGEIGGRCDGVTGACDRNYVYVEYPVHIAKQFKNGLWYNPLTGGS